MSSCFTTEVVVNEADCAQSCKHAATLAGGARMSMERKYDGGKCPIPHKLYLSAESTVLSLQHDLLTLTMSWIRILPDPHRPL